MAVGFASQLGQYHGLRTLPPGCDCSAGRASAKPLQCMKLRSPLPSPFWIPRKKSGPQGCNTSDPQETAGTSFNPVTKHPYILRSPPLMGPHEFGLGDAHSIMLREIKTELDTISPKGRFGERATRRAAQPERRGWQSKTGSGIRQGNRGEDLEKGRREIGKRGKMARQKQRALSHAAIPEPEGRLNPRGNSHIRPALWFLFSSRAPRRASHASCKYAQNANASALPSLQQRNTHLDAIAAICRCFDGFSGSATMIALLAGSRRLAKFKPRINARNADICSRQPAKTHLIISMNQKAASSQPCSNKCIQKRKSGSTDDMSNSRSMYIYLHPQVSWKKVLA
ncbi:uncharacterized protein BDR25DRAFT_393458 [Lindgomyces ingoldianus]|uniref:Uncharacterized protein n=1 Tax=Lindgomyces ingoldianus TaxID=673940 RepID=A0ACB6QWE4_9PLEO|nr:uncharacterized protein BDR25DRAFT_393458 [Lindgomyces ingoldianus]KAF2471328.1 hypothetical protein BDR25DRAFT_393458 [Lindgomyces ingoldianus]